jgi:hypothetical protein
MRSILLIILEFFEDTIIQKTGEKAICSGIWRSEKQYVALTRHEVFPPLGNYKWTLVVRV